MPLRMLPALALVYSVFALGSAVGAWSLPAAAAERVLVIYSFHDQGPWQKGVTDAVREGLKEQRSVPTLFEERLDALRFPEPDSQKAFADALLSKYRSVPLTSVIAVDENAGQLLKEHPEAFPGARRFFVQSEVTPGSAEGEFYLARTDYANELSLVARLFPRTRQVVLIDSDPIRVQTIQASWTRGFSEKFTLDVWSEFSFEELDQKVAALGPQTVLLYGVFGRDRLGRTSIPYDVVKRLSSLAPVPGFVLYDSLMAPRVLGGYVLSANAVGRLVADLILGRAAAPESVSFYRMTFDDEAMRRWGVPRSLLPPLSLVVNTPVPFLSAEQMTLVTLVGLGIAVPLLALWVVLLVLQMRSRARAEAVSEAARVEAFRLRTTLDRVPSLVYTKGLDSRYVYANAAALERLGCSAENLNRQIDSTPLSAEVLNGASTSSEIESIDSQGERRVYWETLSPVHEDSPHSHVIGVMGISTDITARKVAEEALQASEKKFSTLFDLLPTGVVLTDEVGHIVEANRAAQDILGLTRNQTVARSYDAPTWSIVRPDGSPMPVGEYASVRALTQGQTVLDVEMGVTRPDGQVRWLLTSSSPIPISGLGVCIVFVDITERKQREAEMANLQAQLLQSQKMESLGTLAGGVAHDMNNVLAVVLTTATARLLTLSHDEPAYRSFELIARAAERGAKMVKSLLNFARKRPLDARAIDVTNLLGEVVALARITAPESVVVRLEAGSGLHPLRGEESSLSTALLNLLNNAIDAVSGRGIVTLRARNNDNNWVELQVEDDGAGMSPEVLRKAMDPFFTTKAVGKGTGMGLSLVFSTVQAHHGRMQIKSTPSRGTLVKLWFPALHWAGAPAEKASGTEVSGPVVRSLRVLVVDDDDTIRESVRELLTQLGHQPTEASTGETALGLLEDGLEVDVVILDMNMPGLGGKGTLPRLASEYPRLPVLLATGRPDQGAIDLVASHPKATLLPKPYGAGELMQVLAATCNP